MLGYAPLRSASLCCATLRSAALSLASLGSAVLRSVHTDCLYFLSVKLSYAMLGSAALRCASLRFASLRFAQLGSVVIPLASLVDREHLYQEDRNEDGDHPK
jgi:uncharacterized protein YjbI with pentapeptide repeats